MPNQIEIKPGTILKTITLDETITTNTLSGADIVAVGSGANLKHITYSNFIAPVSGGIGNASPSTVPAAGVNTYYARVAGTYTNFGGIVVTDEELDLGTVILYLLNGLWVKEFVAIPFTELLNSNLLIATPSTIPPPSGINMYWRADAPGAYAGFSQLNVTTININLRRSSDTAWSLSDISGFGIRNLDTNEFIPVPLTKDDTFWGTANVVNSGAPNWARSTSIIPITFVNFRVEANTSPADLVYDLKFMKVDNTMLSRTEWLVPLSSPIVVPNDSLIEVIEGEVAFIYGNYNEGFGKVASFMPEFATNKAKYISILPNDTTYPSEKAVHDLIAELLPPELVSVNSAGTSGNPDLINLNIIYDSGAAFSISDIKELRIVSDTGGKTVVSLVENSYWTLDGTVSSFPNWARSDQQYALTGRVLSVELEIKPGASANPALFTFDLKFMRSTALVSGHSS